MSDLEPQAPPVSEEIHLPGPSILPLFNAAGLMIGLIGVTVALWLVIIGALLFFGTLIRWIADTRRDINELPLEH